jgi:glyoxylase-like metal-dependent hydrolase (beta-lactamase superfamily II)
MNGLAALPSGEELPDDIYQIFQVRFARLTNRRVRDNFMMGDPHDGPMPIDYNFWIVRNGGRTILVDTGFSPRAAEQRGRQLDVDPIAALAALGIDPDKVTDAILTHLHYDHAGNIGRLAGARFHVQDAEVAFATGRCMCDKLLRWPFDGEDVANLVRHIYADRVCFHDGDASPFPGISLHVLPGHTKGMQAVQVMTARGPIVLASDVTHHYANFVRASPSPLTVDTIETLESYRRLLKMAGDDIQRIVPGHDPKVYRDFPRYTVGGVEVAALHEAPAPKTLEDLARVDDF